MFQLAAASSHFSDDYAFAELIFIRKMSATLACCVCILGASLIIKYRLCMYGTLCITICSGKCFIQGLWCITIVTIYQVYILLSNVGGAIFLFIYTPEVWWNNTINYYGFILFALQYK